MDKKNLKARLEAILFVYGEPLSIERAAKIINCKTEEILETVKQLQAELENQDRGLKLISNDKSLQLVTKPNHADLIKKLIKEEVEEELTPTLTETLAIIAYTGPISQAGIEAIRGVNSSFTLSRLMIRGLIYKKDDDYFLSNDTLLRLGVNSQDQLPDYQKYHDLQASDNN